MAGQEYFVGQVADILGGGKKKKSDVSIANKLASLFDGKHKVKYTNTNVKSVHKNSKVSKAEAKQTKNSNNSKHVIITSKGKKVAKNSKKNTNLTETMEIKEKKKKKKKKSINSESSVSDSLTIKSKQSKHTEGFCPPKGVVHEFIVKGTTEKTEKTRKRKREDDDEAQSEEDDDRQRPKRNKRDKTKDKRTVFVGNLPLDVKKATVKKLFSKFGTIDNMRYRCPPRSDPKISKKLTVIRKEFHSKRSNIVSFVCFQDVSSAQNALALNGYDMDGFHLRVDLSSNNKKHNKSKSVFVGNVHFEVEEDALRDHFEPCGVIENVRIVRDRKTGLGKGFAFVEFSEKMSIDLALKLHDSKFKGKQLRVTKCEEVVKAKQKDYSHPAQQRILKKATKLGKKPTNLRPGEKRKPKSVKKRDKAKKPRHRDQLKKAFSAPTTTNGSNKHIKFD